MEILSESEKQILLNALNLYGAKTEIAGRYIRTEANKDKLEQINNLVKLLKTKNICLN